MSRATRSLQENLPAITEELRTFAHRLDFDSVTSGGIPPNFFEEVMGVAGRFVDRWVRRGESVGVRNYVYDEHFWERAAQFDPTKPWEGRTAARLEQDLGLELSYKDDRYVHMRSPSDGRRISHPIDTVDFYYLNEETGTFIPFDAVTFVADRPNAGIEGFLRSIDRHLIKSDVTIVIDVEELVLQRRFEDVIRVYDRVDQRVREGRIGPNVDYIFVPPRRS
jgi:hypothetical protein